MAKTTADSLSAQDVIRAHLADSRETLARLANEAPLIEKAARAIARAFRRKKKLIAFGNGGSAADAQHLTAELSGRFEKERPGLPAVALTTNSSAVTAIANDYSYNDVFSRQLQNFVNKGDVVVAISTSGNSENVLEGVKEAKKAGALVIGWTGKGGGLLKKQVDICLDVPAQRTSRIQEGHLVLLHILCALVEEDLFPDVQNPKAQIISPRTLPSPKWGGKTVEFLPLLGEGAPKGRMRGTKKR